jgi:TM2 domain-containing membrane protein YozV
MTTVAPPPPPGGAPQAPLSELRQISSAVVPSMYSLFGTELATAPTYQEPDAIPVSASEPKSRTTFIVLGALLGAVGAHNFYAGYHKKAVAQLLITGLTLGFGSPMSWIWAIIDICTVNQDNLGVQFES